MSEEPREGGAGAESKTAKIIRLSLGIAVGAILILTIIMAVIRKFSG